MDDLETLLASVQAELNQSRLAKADGDDDGDDAAPAPGASASPAPESAPADSASAAPGAPGASAPGAGAPPMDPASAGPGAGDPAASASAAPDLGALKAEYDSLPTEELQLHYLACKAALMGKMGSASPSPSPGMGGADASASAAPPGAPPPGGSAPPMADNTADQSSNPMPPTQKSELAAPKAQAGVKPGMGTSAPMAKNEDEMADKALKDAVERLEKSQTENVATIDKLAGIVARIAGLPQRKSIAGVSEVQVLAKTEADGGKPAGANPLAGKANLRRGELDVNLRKAVDIQLGKKLQADIAKLSKSDRDAIKNFDLGSAALSQVEHLLG